MTTGLQKSTSKDHPPAVSVILPTYNRAALISRAIQSVLGQTFVDFELLIIDDGSTDDTASVISTFSDPRIIYCRIDHQERSTARNVGVSLSRGSFIAFLDSDDWFLPNKLAVQTAVFQENPQLGFVLGGWQIVNEYQQIIQEMRPWDFISGQPTLEDWLFSLTSTPVSVLVKKSWLEQVKGFDPRLTISEDIELWIRLSLAGCQFGWSKENIATVLVHGKNSLRDWPVVRTGRFIYLDKIFSLQGFQSALRCSKQEVYAHHFLHLSWLAYDSGLPDHGKEELLNAIRTDPSLLDAHGDRLIRSMIDYAFYFLTQDPIMFIEKVFKDFPMGLGDESITRRRLLSLTWMSRAWRAFHAGNLSLVRKSVLYAFLYHPQYLKDRGFQSILLQSFFGKSVFQALTKPTIRLLKRAG